MRTVESSKINGLHSISYWLDLYWRRIIRPDGSSVEKDHPSSIFTGRTMRRTIGVSCDSSRVL